MGSNKIYTAWANEYKLDVTLLPSNVTDKRKFVGFIDYGRRSNTFLFVALIFNRNGTLCAR